MKRLFAIAASAVMTLALGTAVWAGGTEDADEGTDTVVAASGGKYNEAPMLAALVAAGELPPVDERLPVEPKVIVPFEMVGRYGGTITTFNPDSSPWGDLSDGPENGSAFLLELSYEGDIVADIATDYEMSKRTTAACCSPSGKDSSGPTATRSPPTTSCSGGRRSTGTKRSTSGAAARRPPSWTASSRSTTARCANEERRLAGRAAGVLHPLAGEVTGFRSPRASTCPSTTSPTTRTPTR